MDNIININNLFGFNKKTIIEEVMNYDYIGVLKKDLDIIVSFPFKHGIFVKLITIMFLVLYGGNIWLQDNSPDNIFMKKSLKMPKYIVKFIKNIYVRVFILSLIIYKSNKNPLLSIIISLAFTYTFDFISSYEIEKFSSDSNINSIESTQTIQTTQSKDILDTNSSNDSDSVTISNTNNSDDNQILLNKEDIKLQDSKQNNTDNIMLDTNNIDNNLNLKLEVPKNNTTTLNLNENKIENSKNNQKTNDLDDSKEITKQSNEQCDGLCSKISYNELVEKVKSDEFSQKYYDSIKDCMVVDLLQKKNGKELRSILKKLDLTHNDIDGPIGTAYVNYSDAISRVNI